MPVWVKPVKHSIFDGQYEMIFLFKNSFEKSDRCGKCLIKIRWKDVIKTQSDRSSV